MSYIQRGMLSPRLKVNASRSRNHHPLFQFQSPYIHTRANVGTLCPTTTPFATRTMPIAQTYKVLFQSQRHFHHRGGLPKPFSRASSPRFPFTRSRRHMADRHGRGKGGIDESENPDGSMMGEKQERQELAPRPETPDPSNRVHSRNLLPEHLRGTNMFRRGLDVPRLNNEHWLNKMLLEPYIALKGNSFVWWDTQIRFTKLGFLLLHLASLAAAGFVTYHAPRYFWADYHENMYRSRHLYMIDVARLLWVQQAIRNCELVIQNRKDGVIPGLLLTEALQDITETPFRTPDYRQTHDLRDRAAQHRAAAEKAAKRRAEVRAQLWGDYTPAELDEKRDAKRRLELLRETKSGSMPEYTNHILETKEQIRSQIRQEKSGFRSKYIQPYLPVTTPAPQSSYPQLSSSFSLSLSQQQQPEQEQQPQPQHQHQRVPTK